MYKCNIYKYQFFYQTFKYLKATKYNLLLLQVQPSHSVCYVPYSGEEVPLNDYEVLVS